MARQIKSKRKTAAQRKRLVRQWKRHGGGLAKFCRRHGLKQATFYVWRKRFKQTDGKPALRRPFVPVSVIHAPAAESIRTVELVLRCGRILKASDGISPMYLAQLAEALEAKPC